MDTKGIITDSVISLMKKKSISDITVQDILNDAHISRRTFYCHFNDKYDVVNHYFSSQMSKEIKADFNGQNWGEITTKLFCFLRDNAYYFKQINEDHSSNSFNNFLIKWFERKFTGFYLYNKQLESLQTEEEFLRISFYAMGMLAYTNNILKNPEKFKNDKTLQQYANTITAEIPEIYRLVQH